MKRTDFFSLLPPIDAQFGNLVVIRDKADKTNIPGFQECFLSSIIQFQPLGRLCVRSANGTALPLIQVSSSSDPVKSNKVFEGRGIRLSQELVVSNDEASLAVKIERMREGDEFLAAAKNGGDIHRDVGDAPYTLILDGACLFSPQGIPYHWREEGQIRLQSLGSAVHVGEGLDGIGGAWTYGNVPFSLVSSVPFDQISLRKISGDDITRTNYFSSFNLKKRCTYWVEPKDLFPSGADDGDSVVSRNAGYAASIELGTLETAQEIVFSFVAEDREGSRDGQPVASAGRHAELVRRSTAGWDDFLGGVPEFHCDDNALERMYYTSWFVLKANRVHFKNPRFPYSFTSVNKYHYYNQFFWDSAYQSIAWLWYNEPEPAQDELRNFTVNQWRNGMIPYELFLYPVNSREWMDGDGASAGMTQPPVIGIALAEIYKKYGNKEYLEYFYDSLLRYEEWLTLYRDFGKRGLSCYLNIWETGWDNSPRLDASARNRVLDPAIESADFNAYIYYMRKTILGMAAALEREAPARIADRMAATKHSMNTLMYDPSDGFYHDIIAGTADRIDVKTAAGLIPLITDIPEEDRRRRIVQRYVASENEFLSGCPVPSVSRSEKSYNPTDFWRGANWPQITWTIVFALATQEPMVAGEILSRFLAATEQNHSCYEYYNAETGEGVGMPFQGWGALYTDMILRFVAGINPEDRGMRFNPLSANVADFSVRNLRLKDMSLRLARRGSTWTFEFDGYGAFAIEGAGGFVAVIDTEHAVLDVGFADCRDAASVRILSGKEHMRFH